MDETRGMPLILKATFAAVKLGKCRRMERKTILRDLSCNT
jgi:hypothetical protein